MHTKDFIEAKLKQRKVLLISKVNSASCQNIEGILSTYNLNRERSDNYEVLYIESRQDCGAIETYLWHKLIYRNRQVPHLFIGGVHVGGEIEIRRLHDSGKLLKIFSNAGLCTVDEDPDTMEKKKQSKTVRRSQLTLLEKRGFHKTEDRDIKLRPNTLISIPKRSSRSDSYSILTNTES